MAQRYDRKLAKRDKIYEVPLKAVKDRPLCRACKKTLKPYYHFQSITTPPPVNRVFYHITYLFKGKYGYEGNGHFCSQRCGYRFALAVVKGTR